MTITRRFKLILCVALAICEVSCKEKKLNDYVILHDSENSLSTVGIASTAIMPPIGYYTLIKLGNNICAVKIYEVWQSQSKMDAYYALYEWHLSKAGSNALLDGVTSGGKGKASYNYIHYYGPFDNQRGNLTISCDGMKIGYTGRTTLVFADPEKEYSESQAIQRGMKIAPTKWTEFSKVDINNPNLLWYAYDANRMKYEISISSLPD